MAYTSAQKRQHILEIQRYLYAISLYDSNIPQVVPDGNYGQDTVLAVRAFQKEYGLPVSGNTDPATWNRIVHVYRGYLDSAPLPYSVFPSAKYVLGSGDTGELVYIVQAMLNNIGNNYDNAPCVDICGSYDTATADAVRQFQRRTGLPQTGKLDSVTWNMLVHCCEHIGHK